MVVACRINDNDCRRRDLFDRRYPFRNVLVLRGDISAYRDVARDGDIRRRNNNDVVHRSTVLNPHMHPALTGWKGSGGDNFGMETGEASVEAARRKAEAVVLSCRVRHTQGQPCRESEATATAAIQLHSALRENSNRSSGDTVLYPQMSSPGAIRIGSGRKDLSRKPGDRAVTRGGGKPKTVELANGIRYADVQAGRRADTAAATAVDVHEVDRV